MNPLLLPKVYYYFFQTVINYFLKERKPNNWKTIVVSVGSTLIISKVWSSYSDCQDGVLLATKKKFFKTLRFVYNVQVQVHNIQIRKLPWVKKKIDEELSKTMSDLKADANKQLKGLEYHRNIPELGWDQEKIVAEIEKLMGLGDYKVHNRKLFHKTKL